MIKKILNVASYRRPRLVIAAYIFGSFVAISPRPACATTILVLLDQAHNRAILAADGLATGRVRQKACKVFLSPNCVFAVFGWDISVDVLESALKACATSGNLDTRADAFFDIVRAPVTNHVANLARQGPSALDGILRDGLFTVMFLGRVNGYFVMASRGVGINADRSLQFLKNDELGNPNKLVRVVAGSGEGEDGIDSYLRSHPNWDEKDIAIAAKDILQAAIAAAPDEVGPPITVLEVDHNPLSTDPDEINMHWVEPGACKQMPQGQSE